MSNKKMNTLAVTKYNFYYTHYPTFASGLKIDLKQQTIREPAENFDLELTSKVDTSKIAFYSDCKAITTYNYYLTLKFYNYLHDFCNKYCYEVIVKALIFVDGHREEQTLFWIAKNRISDKIQFKGTYVLNLSTVNNYNLYIRRYKGAEPIQNAITLEDSVGSMLLNTGAYSDIVLKVGDTILHAHKMVLSQKSEVFKRMFAHQMTESENGVVKIDNLDVEVVEEMLSYIYTGRADNVAEMPQKLFEAAHRYELSELQDLCEEYILFSFNDQNVMEILEIANLYDLTALRTGIITFVEKGEKKLILDPDFQNFLCRSLKINNAVETLLLIHRYKEILKDIEKETFKFIKEHDEQMMKRVEFIKLFESHPNLIKQIFIYIYEIKTLSKLSKSSSNGSSSSNSFD
ncbi:kelch-like protein 24a [Phymastichus coffea]|uniref:kelch-like protein 24a n=1 Tax=Phymastichus coffea TaxID=108790 RepID=UPI00273BA87F|nr:kelch-like protein 24a [Phymastichus coffea]